jgi:hypothetical protein
MKPEGVSEGLWNIACHEASHEVCARYFGLPTDAVATETEGSCLHPRFENLHTNSVIGWGGWIGEFLITGSLTGVSTPSVKLSGYTIREWAGSVALSFWNCHSPPKDWLDAAHGFSYLTEAAFKSCRDSYQIVSSRLDCVRARAEVLIYFAQKRRAGASDHEIIARFRSEAEVTL